jgi:3D (Asp-Asp-Asp) domain-containing protein
MSRPIKLPLKSVQEVKKNELISAAAIGAVVILLTILTVIIALPGDDDSLTADVTAMAASADSEKIITVNPHPYYNVKISADGVTRSVKSTGTVADAVRDAGVYIDDDDLINIGLSEALTPSTEIVISRVEIVEEVKLETIDYTTKYKEDENYVIGYSKVLVDGEEGELSKVIQHTYVDGKLTQSSVVSTEVTEEPVDKVVVMGTAEVNPIEEMSISTLSVPDYLTLDENGVPTSYTSVLTGKSCAYSAKPTAKTASGRQVKVGYVAVDPDIIPYGTELYIASTDGKYVYGYAIAADTGTALLDGTILVDLFMESYDASCDWGAKQVNIYIL